MRNSRREKAETQLAENSKGIPSKAQGCKVRATLGHPPSPGHGGQVVQRTSPTPKAFGIAAHPVLADGHQRLTASKRKLSFRSFAGHAVREASTFL